MKIAVWITLTGLVLVWAQDGQACTNYLVSKGASTDGSAIITYSAKE